MRKLTLLFVLYGIFLLIILHVAIPVDIFLAMLVAFLFCGTIVGFIEYKEGLAESSSDFDRWLEKKEGLRKKLALEEQALDGYISELRQKEMMIVSLYEITKKMSQSLTFDEIFRELSVFLKDNFMFTEARLMILKEDSGSIHVERVYKVYKDDEDLVSPHQEAADIDYSEILNLFVKDKKEIFVTKEGKEAKTFSAIPLLSENKFVGIFTVEGLARVDFDKLVIVAMQFALEMKKVLLYETVETLAITDGLTGLYTRRYFFERLNEELKRSKEHSFKFAFLMIDIDDFKICNDTYGHMVGDVILRDVARLIKESTREIDLVARYGGEEFSLVLPETDKKGALQAAERIRKKIDEHTFKAYDEKLKVTVSVGLSIYPDDSEDAQDLIEKSDKAMYLAKSSGKNIVCEYAE